MSIEEELIKLQKDELITISEETENFLLDWLLKNNANEVKLEEMKNIWRNILSNIKGVYIEEDILFHGTDNLIDKDIVMFSSDAKLEINEKRTLIIANPQMMDLKIYPFKKILSKLNETGQLHNSKLILQLQSLNTKECVIEVDNTKLKILNLY